MMRMLSCSALVFAVVSAGATAGAYAATDRHPTPEQTLAEFRSYCERVTESLDPYFGHAAVPAAEARLAGATDPEGQIRAHLDLAYHLTRLGDHPRAIEHARASLALLERAGYARSPVALAAWKILGVAHYQLGEDANCIALHTEGSCVLPVRPEAVHRQPQHARDAAEAFLHALELKPDDVNSRWLLVLSRMVAGEYPEGVPEALRLPAGAFDSPAKTTIPLWVDVAPRLGIAGQDLAGGAIVDDFDGDGRLDLVSSSWDPCKPLTAYRSDGRGGFENVTAAWGLDAQLGGLNLVHADYDGDGDLDLLVMRGAWLGRAGRIRRSLLRNDLAAEAHRFVDVTVSAGLAFPAYPSQAAAWADYDGDGDLDLYVGTEADRVVIDPSEATGAVGGYPSHLFRNDGNGLFTDVARAAGVQDRGFTKGVAWGDYDNDGDEDLFLSNFGPDRLFRNRGDGTFEDVTAEAGVDGGDRRNFATWFFDFDHDGDLDLFVASFHGPAASIAAWHLGYVPRDGSQDAGILPPGNPFLYRNDGGRFTEISHEAGLVRPHLVMGANFGDVDADGWLDFYLGTGQPDFAALHPNALYRNTGRGTFEDLTFQSGLAHLQKGHGVAFGDLDGDGDEDLFHQLGGAFPYDAFGNALYLNPSRSASSGEEMPHWVVLRLRGVEANRFGIGARVRLDVRDGSGARRSIHRRVDSGGSFGGSSLQLEIGLGDATAIERIEVRWPGSGTVSRFANVVLDTVYEVVEGSAELRAIDLPPLRLRLAAPEQPAAAHQHRGSP